MGTSIKVSNTGQDSGLYGIATARQDPSLATHSVTLNNMNTKIKNQITTENRPPLRLYVYSV